MAKQTRGKKRGPKKGSRKASRKGSKRSSQKRKTIQKKLKPTTKYKTGESDDYEGSCNQEKVQECVDQGKYCNVDTNKCIAPKGVKTKVNKDKTLAVDPSYGIVGKTQAVNNIKKYLEKLSASEEKHKLLTNIISKTIFNTFSDLDLSILIQGMSSIDKNTQNINSKNYEDISFLEMHRKNSLLTRNFRKEEEDFQKETRQG